MLVLSRRLGEKIVVPEFGLSVAILGVQGGRVRLGISAPPEVLVQREELSRAAATEAAGDAGPGQDRWDALATDLSDAAYRIALRHRPAGSWLKLQIEVSRALNRAIRQWKQRFLPSPAAARAPLRPVDPIRLPR